MRLRSSLAAVLAIGAHLGLSANSHRLPAAAAGASSNTASNSGNTIGSSVRAASGSDSNTQPQASSARKPAIVHIDLATGSDDARVADGTAARPYRTLAGWVARGGAGAMSRASG